MRIVRIKSGAILRYVRFHLLSEITRLRSQRRVGIRKLLELLHAVPVHFTPKDLMGLILAQLVTIACRLVVIALVIVVVAYTEVLLLVQRV